MANMIILLPFNAKIIPPLIILIVLVVVIFGDRKNWYEKIISSIPYTGPLVALYILAAVSILWSVDKGITLKDLELNNRTSKYLLIMQREIFKLVFLLILIPYLLFYRCELYLVST